MYGGPVSQGVVEIYCVYFDHNGGTDRRSGGYHEDKKMKYVKRIILIALMCILSGAVLLYFTEPITIAQPKSFKITQGPFLKATLTKEQALSDAFQMVGFLEEVHPMFLKKQTAQYVKMKEQYLSAAQKALTVSDFRVLTSRFLASLNDGHTKLIWTDTDALDVNWKWINSALVIGPNCSLPQNAQVLSIGGIPVSKIASVNDKKSCFWRRK